MIVKTGGVAVESLITDRIVVAAGGVAIERLRADGSAEGTVGVSLKSLIPERAIIRASVRLNSALSPAAVLLLAKADVPLAPVAPVVEPANPLRRRSSPLDIRSNRLLRQRLFCLWIQ